MTNTSKVITCKGAVCWGAGEDVRLEEIQVDPPKANEVRVKMICASICHSDITSIQGLLPYFHYPLALGHEGVGVVETVGDGVTNFKEGDMVIPTYIGECKECEHCISGKSNMCLTYPMRFTGLMPDNTSRMSCRGNTLYYCLTFGTWSEYTVIDVNYLVKVDPSMNPAHASFISCGFSTGYGAAWKEARVEKGSSVAVFGLGAVGLGAISGAKMMGASNIIGIDTNDMKREKGEAFGMTHFINPKDSEKSPSTLVKELSNGCGVDCSFECTGVGPLLTESLEATKLGSGKAISIGAGNEVTIPFGHGSLLFGRTLKGSIFGGLKAISDLSIMADKCQKQEFPLEELHTHEVQLGDINEAFEMLKQPSCVKIVIKM
ncbi:hypothetical protein PIB30_033561 [Stylosanthes scabra]|uniref:Enoyl reductase (ER) domain-containing protein n=1 Tax=Stylosanthes scabra TaxID=79078 RepID=A0ABU6WAZ0_9FABA|nr:hypothetical protein [Stylosanthes scabra]